MEQLLIRKLESLRHGDASPQEMLRHIPATLESGAILISAETLVKRTASAKDLEKNHEWLKPFICLETSYCVSAGPMGRAYKEMSFWEQPKKPFWGITPIIALVFLMAGVIGYFFEATNEQLFKLACIGFAVCFVYWMMKHQVAMNAWDARRELDENIIRDAKYLESMLDEIRRNAKQPIPK